MAAEREALLGRRNARKPRWAPLVLASHTERDSAPGSSVKTAERSPENGRRVEQGREALRLSGQDQGCVGQQNPRSAAGRGIVRPGCAVLWRTKPARPKSEPRRKVCLRTTSRGSGLASTGEPAGRPRQTATTTAIAEDRMGERLRA